MTVQVTDKAGKSNPVAVAAAPKEPEVPVQLELALYSRYNRAGHLYEREMVYEFNPSQARILLAEVEAETGRPIWRRYKPKPTAQEIRMNNEQRRVVNATKDNVAPQVTEGGVISSGRLDVGSDEDLADLNLGDGVEI